MSLAKTFVTALAVFLLPVSYANELTGTIHTLHVNLQTNLAHIYLDGSPIFNGGGCTNRWTANPLDEEKFMIYIWPALMNAKNRGFAVSVNVSGCVDGYPRIVSVDVVPR